MRKTSDVPHCAARRTLLEACCGTQKRHRTKYKSWLLPATPLRNLQHQTTSHKKSAFPGDSRAPCRRLVRQTSNSDVAGLPIEAAEAPSSGRSSWVKFSAREHSAQVRISVKPAMAHSARSSSSSALSGSSAPIAVVDGTVHSMLLYPYAIATSCHIHDCYKSRCS